ncbi:MAG: S8 family serine peptidase [Planctomycetota bacterium]
MQPLATVAGAVIMPEVVPQTFASNAPMVAGEVVVWLEPGKRAADLDMVGFDLVRASGGPMAVYHAHRADGKSSRQDGAQEEDCVERATCEAADVMALREGVLAASPNYLLQPCIEPNDTNYNLQWHYEQINMPQTWDVTQGSSDVIVAVLDTGIVSAHPDFSGRLIGGFDMISNPQIARDGDGRDANPEDVGDLITPQGSSFHGTHVAGTIGANGNDGSGVAGVDWNCRLMTVRCLGQGGGSIDDIANGILYAAGLPNGSGALPPQRADIINMSLGGPGLSPVLEQACNQAAAAGVLLVAAAGNDNSDQPNSPAAFDSVLSVGAVDLVKQRAPYSNFSTTVDIWAPGGDMSRDRNGDSFPDGVLSTISDDQGNLGFKFENGTSMASPHVAGVAALVKAADPSLSASQIRDVLIQSAEGGLGLPNGGRLLDALAAVQAASAAQGNNPTAPVLVASSSAADFGPDSTTLNVTLRNEGSGQLNFVDGTITPPVSWLDGQVFDDTPNDGIDGDRLELVADRTGLPNGVEQATVTLEYDNGSGMSTIDIVVRLQVGQSTTADETVFVLLVDPFSFETFYQAETTQAQSYAFVMPGVAAGDYLLVAGTDRDNDDFLGDDGELFGAWPNIDRPTPIEIAAGSSPANIEFRLQDLVTVQSVGPGGELLQPRRAFRRLR